MLRTNESDPYVLTQKLNRRFPTLVRTKGVFMRQWREWDPLSSKEHDKILLEHCAEFSTNWTQYQNVVSNFRISLIIRRMKNVLHYKYRRMTCDLNFRRLMYAMLVGAVKTADEAVSMSVWGAKECRPDLSHSMSEWILKVELCDTETKRVFDCNDGNYLS